jgi:alpha-L-fucosidase
MLRTAAAFGGNLLLNVGPMADGTFPPVVLDRWDALGQWLEVHGEAVFGPMDRVDGVLEGWTNAGYWTLSGSTAYFWLLRSDPLRVSRSPWWRVRSSG